MGPGLLAEHLVALQAGLVGLAVGVAGPPHAHVLHQAQVGHLVAHQGVREDTGRLLVIGLNAPVGREEKISRVRDWDEIKKRSQYTK